MVPSLPAALPRRGGPLSRLLGRAALRLLRWRIVGNLPDVSRAMVIAAPHRSNWDFIVGIAAKFALGLDASWIGKHTLFRRPFGTLFRFLGGIPVDRSSPQDTVATVVARFAEAERLVVALAPEGTRRRGTRWKRGFWHIARGAGVPVVLVVFDRPHRELHILPPLTATDLDEDIRTLQSRCAELTPGEPPAG